MKILILLLCLALAGCAPVQKAEPTTPPTEPQIEIREEECLVGIGYGSIYCEDPSLPEGKMEVLFSGRVGQARQACLVTYENGKQTEKQVLQEEILRQPVHQIVAVGTGENTEKARTYPLFGENCIITQSGEVLEYSHRGRFSATAYTSGIADVGEITATGTKARVGAIAVDPKVIPYGTKMFIVTEDGQYVYGIATAEDCGGGIKGNRIDLFFDTVGECYAFGARMCQVYFLI